MSKKIRLQLVMQRYESCVSGKSEVLILGFICLHIFTSVLAFEIWNYSISSTWVSACGWIVFLCEQDNLLTSFCAACSYMETCARHFPRFIAR